MANQDIDPLVALSGGLFEAVEPDMVRFEQSPSFSSVIDGHAVGLVRAHTVIRSQAYSSFGNLLRVRFFAEKANP